jgi:hypothetical protein
MIKELGFKYLYYFKFYMNHIVYNDKIATVFMLNKTK